MGSSGNMGTMPCCTIELTVSREEFGVEISERLISLPRDKRIRRGIRGAAIAEVATIHRAEDLDQGRWSDESLCDQ